MTEHPNRIHVLLRSRTRGAGARAAISQLTDDALLTAFAARVSAAAITDREHLRSVRTLLDAGHQSAAQHFVPVQSGCWWTAANVPRMRLIAGVDLTPGWDPRFRYIGWAERTLLPGGYAATVERMCENANQRLEVWQSQYGLAPARSGPDAVQFDAQRFTETARRMIAARGT
jgi:hypothetical protein